MTVGHLIIVIVLFVLGTLGAYWIITKFFEPPLRMPILAIVGALLLIALLAFFMPGVMGTKLW